MNTEFVDDLKSLFEKANESFVLKNKDLFDIDVSERSLCAELKSAIEEEIKTSEYADYFVQTEYNRYQVGTEVKKKITTYDGDTEPKTIVCDLIIHGRGKKGPLDNLIALEMKKSTASQDHKNDDKKRLEALTSEADANLYSKGVRGYQLGIYYEIDRTNQKIFIDYFSNGKKMPDASRVIPY